MPDQSSAPDEAITVFLSYARTDHEPARKVTSALEQAGFTVWWDEKIEGGAAYARSIADALDTADAVVVLWSRNSIESDWVRDEAAQGRERHRLVPLSLDRSKAPLGFRQYQLIDISTWHGGPSAPQIQAVSRAIRAVSGRRDPEKTRPAPALSRRTALIAASAAGVSLIGAGLIVADKRGLFGRASISDSIAVLPFKNLSGDPMQSYLSDGLTEEIRAALIRNNALRVLAATSSGTERKENEDLIAFSRRLGVSYLLGGSVLRGGDLLRISTVLTDGKTGFGLWSNTLDRNMSDIFAVEDEIARAVADALSIRMATSKPTPGGTRNVAAYESYLRGKALFNQAKDEPSDRAALADFDNAIAADPRFALAYAARSRSFSGIATTYGKANELKPLYDAAITAAQRAVNIAPDLAEGHLALGYAIFTGRLDIQGARRSYDRAYQLGSGNADTALFYALYCSHSGRPDEAREAMLRALSLDRLNPRAYRAAGSVEYAARRYSSAIPYLRKALSLNPNMTYSHALIGHCFLQLGRSKEAQAEFDAEPLAFARLSGLAIVDRRLGYGPAAEKAYAQLVREVGDSALYQQAQVLADWGRTADALAALERARTVGDAGLTYLATDQLMDPLRREPRFIALLKALHFT